MPYMVSIKSWLILVLTLPNQCHCLHVWHILANVQIWPWKWVHKYEEINVQKNHFEHPMLDSQGCFITYTLNQQSLKADPRATTSNPFSGCGASTDQSRSHMINITRLQLLNFHWEKGSLAICRSWSRGEPLKSLTKLFAKTKSLTHSKSMYKSMRNRPVSASKIHKILGLRASC